MIVFRSVNLLFFRNFVPSLRTTTGTSNDPYNIEILHLPTKLFLLNLFPHNRKKTLVLPCIKRLHVYVSSMTEKYLYSVNRVNEYVYFQIKGNIVSFRSSSVTSRTTLSIVIKGLHPMKVRR